MNHWLKSLSLLTIVGVEAHLLGWGGRGITEQAPSMPALNFPMNDDQAWFVKPSYLIWRPNQEDTDIGLSYYNNGNGKISQKVREIDFSWGSGARVGIGRYLPNHEQWDVSLFTTYYYNNSQSHAKGSLPGNSVFTTTTAGVDSIEIGWSPDLLGDAINAVYGFRLNYFTMDLSIAREFSLTRTIVVHPLIGLRSALIYEKYYDRNKSLFILGSSTFAENLVERTKFTAKNDFWGVGPRIGADFSFAFGSGWKLMGSLSGSFLYSRYRIRERIQGFSPNGQETALVSADVKIRDAQFTLTTNIDASIGLGWESWVRNNTVRIAPSFVFEAVKWYGYNHWLSALLSAPSDLIFSISSGSSGSTKRHSDGDLGLFGFSLNLQIDF